MFADDPELLSRAIDYVIMWQHTHAGETVLIPEDFLTSNAVHS
jgi:hypothetical protein